MLKKVLDIVSLDDMFKARFRLGESYGEIVQGKGTIGFETPEKRGGPEPENESEEGQWRGRHTEKDAPDVNNPSPVPASTYKRREKKEAPRSLVHVFGDPAEDAPASDVSKSVPSMDGWKRSKSDASGTKPREYSHTTDHGTYRIKQTTHGAKPSLTFHPAQKTFGASRTFHPLGDHPSVAAAISAAGEHHSKLSVKKAVYTKDRSPKTKPAPKPSKSNARGTDEKGRKRYDYKASGGQKAKTKPGAKNGKQAAAKPVQVQHPGVHYLQQIAHVTRTNPESVARLARRFKTSDEFLRWFKVHFGKLASKHGIHSHHIHHIHDASQYAKSDVSLVLKV